MPSDDKEPTALENLFDAVPSALDAEQFRPIVSVPGVQIERIVSTGQATPEGDWYDQDKAEWVLVLKGRAGLLFEGEDAPRVMGPGDHILIPAHRRHQVAWTAPDEPTVWLAVHFEGGSS